MILVRLENLGHCVTDIILILQGPLLRVVQVDKAQADLGQTEAGEL